MKNKEYLGDSVYAEFDGYNVILTTNNYGPDTNTIYLEPNVIEKLNNFIVRQKEKANAESDD